MKRNEEADLLDEWKRGLRIDKHSLDSEIAIQADTFYRVAEMLADATSERDAAKTEVDEVYADISEKTRKSATRNDEKMTEGLLKERVQLSAVYRAAVDAHTKAQAKRDRLFALERAYDMRSKMLREMAQLYIAGYFQTSAVGASRKGSTGDHAKEARVALDRARSTLKKMPRLPRL